MRSSHIFETYYYGEKKWDKYLIDIQDSVEAASAQAARLAKPNSLKCKRRRPVWERCRTRSRADSMKCAQRSSGDSPFWPSVWTGR